MANDSESFLVPFVGAFQASLSVLLTIFYGVLTAQFGLISESAARDVSKACVRLFLPCLLITNVGAQLNPETVHKHLSIQCWFGQD